MNRNSLSSESRLARLSGALSLMAAVGAFGLATNASAKTEQLWIDVAAVTVPNAPIQAAIEACVGEQVRFTGRVHIVMKDGALSHVNWGNMVGETPDGDVFRGGSTVGGNSSTLNISEVGAGPNSRHFQFHAVGGEFAVTCQA